MIVDTSALLAFLDRSEPDHEAVTRLLTETSEALVVSPYVVAELDYLVASRLDVDAELAVLRELAGGAWELASFAPADVVEACAVIERFSDQAIGLADASNVVLASRHRTSTIATLDRRHFEVLRPTPTGRFTILP